MAEQHEQHILNLERQLLGEEANRFQSPSAAYVPSFSNLDPAHSLGSPNSVGSGSGSAFGAGNLSDALNGTPNFSSYSDSQFTAQASSNSDLVESFKSMGSPSGNISKPNYLTDQYQKVGDSEFLSEWKTNIQVIIAQRDEESEAKSREVMEDSKADLDKFYEDYNQKKEAKISENEANQESEYQQVPTGSFWQQVNKQVELANASFEAQGNLMHNSSSQQNLSTKPSQSSVFSDFSRTSDKLKNASGEPNQMYGNQTLFNLVSSLATDPYATDPYATDPHGSSA